VVDLRILAAWGPHLSPQVADEIPDSVSTSEHLSGEVLPLGVAGLSRSGLSRRRAPVLDAPVPGAEIAIHR
jgi:hypothetical protein